MDTLIQDYLLSNPIFYSLALTLLHFLWQGCLIALSLKLSLIVTSPKNPQLRYAFSSLAMLACLVLPLLTFLVIYQPNVAQFNQIEHYIPLLSQASEELTSVSLFNITHATELLPYISAAWLAVVLFLASKLLLEIYLVNQLPQQAIPPTDRELTIKFEQLVNKMKLSRMPQLLISLKVDVPMAIGWLKPVVLVPASMLSGLTSAQLEMLILHELAHIRRHDYLVNFLQTLVSILLFFHPGVQWISKQMRNEREYCSDDIAVHHCGNAIAYAHTLADTAALCSKHRHHTIPNMAMAASGGDLKNRVVRLVDHHCTPSNDVGKWLAGTIIIVTIMGISAQQLLMPSLFDIGQSNVSPLTNNNDDKDELIKMPLAESSLAVQLLNTQSTPATTVTSFNTQRVNNSSHNKNLASVNLNKTNAVNKNMPITFITVESNNLGEALVASVTQDNTFDQNEQTALVQNTQLTTGSLTTRPLVEQAPKLSTPNIQETTQQLLNNRIAKSSENKTKSKVKQPLENASKNTPELIAKSTTENSNNNMINSALSSKANKSQAVTKTVNFTPNTHRVNPDLIAANTKTTKTTGPSLIATNTNALNEKTAKSSTIKKPEHNRFNKVSNSAENHAASSVYESSRNELSLLAQYSPQQEKAELIHSEDPKYPSTAKRKGLELEVQVYFTIDKNGNIKDIEFEEQSKINYFRSSIRNAMKKWTFQPATVDGRPVESQMSKIFSFSLTS